MKATMTSFAYFSFVHSYLTSVKGRLNGTQFPSIKHSLDTNEVEDTGSRHTQPDTVWCGIDGLRPRSRPLATQISLSMSLGEIVGLKANSDF